MRVVFSLMATCVFLFIPACGDKDVVEECEDIKGDLCTDHGLVEELRSAKCDDCGQLWACYPELDGSWHVEDVFLPCSCINDDGFLEVDKDQGPCGPTL